MRDLPGIALHFLEMRVRALRRAVAVDLGDLNRLIAHILRGGVLVSTGVLIAGIAIGTLEGRPLPAAVLRLTELLPSLLRLRPEGLLSFGILLLILTPVVRVALSFVSFVRARDRVYVGITALVLLNLGAAILLGLL